MAGGSAPPVDDGEQQCQHCGRCFADAGVLSHERNCDYAASPHRIHDLECPRARLRAGLEPQPDDDVTVDGLEDASVDVDDDLEQRGAPDRADAATDGGPRSVPTFDEDASDQEARDDVDDGATPDPNASGDPSCPDCGTTEYLVPVDILPDDVLEHDAGPGDKDVLCLECSSTTEDGALAPETVDGERVFRIAAFDREQVVA